MTYFTLCSNINPSLFSRPTLSVRLIRVDDRESVDRNTGFLARFRAYYSSRGGFLIIFTYSSLWKRPPTWRRVCRVSFKSTTAATGDTHCGLGCMAGGMTSVPCGCLTYCGVNRTSFSRIYVTFIRCHFRHIVGKVVPAASVWRRPCLR